MDATALGVAEALFLPEADITSIICSRSHCTMALSGGVDLSQSSNVAMMFLATWDGVSFPLLQDRKSWVFVTRPPLTTSSHKVCLPCSKMAAATALSKNQVRISVW